MEEGINDMTPGDPSKKRPLLPADSSRAFYAESGIAGYQQPLPAEFLSDAEEGMKNLSDENQLDAVLKKLNRQMHQQLAVKKPPNDRRGLWDLSWTYWAIIVVLLLTITGFVVIRLLLRR